MLYTDTRPREGKERRKKPAHLPASIDDDGGGDTLIRSPVRNYVVYEIYITISPLAPRIVSSLSPPAPALSVAPSPPSQKVKAKRVSRDERRGEERRGEERRGEERRGEERRGEERRGEGMEQGRFGLHASARLQFRATIEDSPV